MKIKDMPKEDRPRERLLKVGVSNLSNEELIAIIIGSGTKNISSKELAISLLHEVSNLSNLKELSVERFMMIKGIGESKAVSLVASIELGKRIFIKKENLFKLSSSKDIYEYMKYFLVNKKQEYFYCLYFNNKQELIERKLLFMGTINRSVVHPREVFKQAYLNSASSIICVHNHPSNDVSPSLEDIRLTKALQEIGEISGIPVLDHIIIGDNSFYSFYEHNRL